MLSGHLADVLLVPSGDDVLVIEKSAGGYQADVPANVDQSRRAAKVSLDAAPGWRCCRVPGRLLTDVARAVLAAEATGIAAQTTEMAAAPSGTSSRKYSLNCFLISSWSF